MFAYYLFLLLNLAILHFAVAVYCLTIFIYVHSLWSNSSQLSDQWTVTCVWMLPHTPPSSAILTVLSSVRCPHGVLGDPALMRTARIRQPKKVRLSCITVQNYAFIILTERADYLLFIFSKLNSLIADPFHSEFAVTGMALTRDIAITFFSQYKTWFLDIFQIISSSNLQQLTFPMFKTQCEIRRIRVWNFLLYVQHCEGST